MLVSVRSLSLSLKHSTFSLLPGLRAGQVLRGGVPAEGVDDAHGAVQEHPAATQAGQQGPAARRAKLVLVLHTFWPAWQPLEADCSKLPLHTCARVPSGSGRGVSTLFNASSEPQARLTQDRPSPISSSDAVLSAPPLLRLVGVGVLLLLLLLLPKAPAQQRQCDID